MVKGNVQHFFHIQANFLTTSLPYVIKKLVMLPLVFVLFFKALVQSMLFTSCQSYYEKKYFHNEQIQYHHKSTTMSNQTLHLTPRTSAALTGKFLGGASELYSLLGSNTPQLAAFRCLYHR